MAYLAKNYNIKAVDQSMKSKDGYSKKFNAFLISNYNIDDYTLFSLIHTN